MAISGALVGGLALALGMSLGANAIVLFDLGESDGASNEETVSGATRDVAATEPRGPDRHAATR